MIDTNVQLDNRHVTGNVGQRIWCEAIKHDVALTAKVDKHHLRAETLKHCEYRKLTSTENRTADNDWLLLAPFANLSQPSLLAGYQVQTIEK